MRFRQNYHRPVMILTETEWNGTPNNRKSAEGFPPAMLMPNIEQGRWAQRWVRVAILPDRQVKELAHLAKALMS